jgi:hypothetical protein
MNFLYYITAYLISVPILQSLFCINLKVLGYFFLLILIFYAIYKSNRITVTRSDILIVLILIILNVYYSFIEQRGLIFANPTYILLLSILLSKVIFFQNSVENYFKKIDLIYLIIVFGLLLEYLFLVIFGTEFFEPLMCDASGVQGYRALRNITSDFLSISPTGLNSIMMGAQTASQISLIAFIWYASKNRVSRDKLNFLIITLAIFMFALSPSITAVFLTIIFAIIIGSIYIIKSYENELKNYYKLFISLALFLVILYFATNLLLFKHISFDHVINGLIMSHLEGFFTWDIFEILLGADIDTINNSFQTTEIHFFQHFALYGFIGISVFYLSIIYYCVRALSIYTYLDKDKLMLITSSIIIAIFIFGEVHYYVMFQAGVRELFALHLSYIIYLGSRSPRITLKVE